jgi:hypothetical protein
MSNRTLAEMRLRVRRLAHDMKTSTQERTYSDADVAVALSDSLRELVDRLLADDRGRWSLLVLGEALEISTAEAAGEIELPEECLRLELVQRLREDGQWVRLRRLPEAVPTAEVMALSRRLSADLGYRALPGEAGGEGCPAGWRASEDGLSIALWPWGTGDAVTVRLGYLAEPAWTLTETARIPLPTGADEIVELMAGDKLTADEPRDEKRMAIYRARLDGRYLRWVGGRARGKVDRGQAVAGEE